MNKDQALHLLDESKLALNTIIDGLAVGASPSELSEFLTKIYEVNDQIGLFISQLP